MRIWVIARLTFWEASRRWILWVALLLGLIFLMIYALGFYEIRKEMLRDAPRMSAIQQGEMYNFFLMAGLYVVNFLSLVMTVLTSVDTLSGEIASGTIHTLVSKPMHRWEVVLGKWLGYAAMLLLYLVLMAGGVMGVVYGISGYHVPHALQGFSLMGFNLLLLLSVSFFGGSSLSTLANGTLAFGLYGVAFIGGWIEQFGALMRNQTAINIGILCSLILPSEALWRRAAFEMQSPLVASLGVSPFSSGSVPSPLMIGYAIAYGVAMLVLAVQRFNRRDL